MTDRYGCNGEDGAPSDPKKGGKVLALHVLKSRIKFMSISGTTE
jgi:hypothetical protein